MTRDELKNQANKRFGRLLQSTRAKSGNSLSEVATALDITELELKRAEFTPAEIPCCKLYRIIEFYGADALFEAEIAFQEVNRIGRKFRAAQGQEDKASSTVPTIGPSSNEGLEDAVLAFGLEIAYRQRELRKKGHGQKLTTETRSAVPRSMKMILAFVAGNFLFEIVRNALKSL